MNLILRTLGLLLVSAPAFAAITLSMQSLVEVVVALIIIGLVLGILIFLVRKAPFIPPEWKSGIEYFIYFIAALVVINFLLGLGGMSVVNWK